MGAKSVFLENLAKELEAFSEKQIEDLKDATLLGIANTMTHLVSSSPVDTGLYAQSWDFNKEEFGAVLGNFAPHSPIIEYGARPFMPPLGPLLAWAKRVLQDPSQPPEYSDQVWALARGTQIKISKVGIEPKHIMENAIPVIIENIKAEYRKING